MKNTNQIIKDATRYYEEKFKEYGSTPQGVDWNSKESQDLRFKQLLKVLDNKVRYFAILDYGCGYGSLYEYIRNSYIDFSFFGFDSSKVMIEQARKLHAGPMTKWIYSFDNLKKVDFVVASGIFNVKLNYSDEEWLQYVLETLKHFNDLSTKGFSFNILTKYSDKEHIKDYLYYADPFILFDYCKKTYSKYVALLHDYPLYEFTIIVKK